jgi:MFS transporter, PPP family, 3-phenylpropionic acid transporter
MPSGSPLTRFVLFYAALYGAFGIISPFLPQLLQQRGFSAAEIGTTVALATAIRLVAGPLAGRLADRQRAWRAVLGGCAAAAGLAAMLYLPAHGLAPLLIVSLLHAALLAPLAPLADAMAVSAARHPTRGFEYGRVRGAASAAFIVGVVAGGHVADRLGIDAIIWGNAAALGLAALVALPLPNIAVPAPREPEPGGIRLLLDMPVFRRLLLVGALILGSHALHDTFAVIRWREAGIDGSTASLLWSESVASEVLVFLLLGPALLHRLGPSRAAALAASAGVLRWIILGATTDLVWLSLAEPLHGLTFALLHLAAMQLIGSSVPPRLAATAQAVYGTVAVGGATALLNFASGWLYGWMAGAAFWVMAALCAAAIPLALRLGR